MKQYYFEYKLTPADYRQMTYFNSFKLKRFQGVAVCTIWCACIVLLLLDLFNVLELTRITHICCLVVSVCVPVLVASLEISINRFKTYSCGKDAPLRKMILSDEGVRYAGGGEQESHLDRWQELLRVFELKDIFVFYKDARHTTILPKSAIDEAALPALRAYLTAKLGKDYVLRCR